LERTPYGRDQPSRSEITAADPRPLSRDDFAALFTARGYALVYQDNRGRHGSEGRFVKYLSDGEDGFDCCAWIVRQPWCDGRQTCFGDAEFGPNTTIDSWAGDWRQYRLRHFDSAIRGTPNPEPPVRVFVMGGGSGRRNAAGHLEHGGRRISLSDWPAPDAWPVAYHLHGDGLLSQTPSKASAAPLSYDFDPTHPVPDRWHRAPALC
jgi:predicted acyl esterase